MSQTYSVIAYGTEETDKPVTVRSGLTFEKAKRLKERCDAASDKGRGSYEIHEDEAR